MLLDFEHDVEDEFDIEQRAEDVSKEDGNDEKAEGLSSKRV